MAQPASDYVRRILSYSQGKDPLRLLQSTPKKLAALIKGKNPKELKRKPAPGKWSVAEIMAHLADSEIAISWRLRQVLSTKGAPLQGYDQDAWASTFGYARRDPKRSHESFQLLRENNLAILKGVPRKLWSNHGMHQELGKLTAENIVRLVAGHDVNHLLQIEEILKRKR
ncbi:MAG TPA: DinB family protein [Candidatus Angelobacter sp.]|nr:DinB family protein [Candidatus Angelobacter sp.]